MATFIQHTVQTDNAIPRILVIDDEMAILFAYQRLMSKLGYSLDVCQTREDALQLLATYRYAAIIADLRLTGHGAIEGLELLNASRHLNPGATAIMVTGYGTPEIRQSIGELGAIYLEKPVDPYNVVNLISSRVQFKRT